MKKLTFILSLLLVFACTTNGKNSTYVSKDEYSEYNCNQLKSEFQRVSNQIKQIESQGDSKADMMDAAITVFALSQGYGFLTCNMQIYGQKMRI